MKSTVYIGTYTEGGQHFSNEGVEPGRGIYRTVYDSVDGSFETPRLAAEVVNPSWIAGHPTLPLVYAVTENPVEGFEGGAVHVFRRDGEGRLERLKTVDSRGLAPCHLALDREGRELIVSNYRGNKSGGLFVLYSLDENGLPEADPILFQGAGHGRNRQRQEGPHAHSAWHDPHNGSIVMVDLGLDVLFIRDHPPGELILKGALELRTPPGAGCRHLAFSPDAGNMYVVGELDCSVHVFTRNRDGNLEGPIQSISALPEKIPMSEKPFTSSAICIHPSGRFLFVSNRGYGTISVFRCEDNGRRLSLIQVFPIESKVPRYCTLAPEGRTLIVCGLDNATIQTLPIDPETGQLSTAGHSVRVDSPACLLFV